MRAPGRFRRLSCVLESLQNLAYIVNSVTLRAEHIRDLVAVFLLGRSSACGALRRSGFLVFVSFRCLKHETGKSLFSVIAVRADFCVNRASDSEYSAPRDGAHTERLRRRSP